jgi:hypothetical protein
MRRNYSRADGQALANTGPAAAVGGGHILRADPGGAALRVLRISRLWLALCLPVVAAMAMLSACSHTSHSATSKSSAPANGLAKPVTVHVSSATALNLAAGGVKVIAPVGALSGSGTLTASSATPPTPVPTGLVFASPVYHLELVGASIVSTVTLTLPAPTLSSAGEKGAASGYLAYLDESTHQWTPVDPAVYDAAGPTVSVQTPHLSWWSWLTAPLDAVNNVLKSAIEGFIGTSDHADQPHATGEAQAKSDGLTATSTSGGLLKWSLGESASGQGLLQVANNRRFAVEVDYPSGWSATDVGWSDIDQKIVSAVATKLSVAPNGQHAVVIPGGDSVTFTIPPGARGQLSATPSSEAYLVTAFLYGVDTLLMTMDALPGAPAKDDSKTAQAVDAIGTTHDCALADQHLSTATPTSLSGAASLLRAYMDFAVGCLGSLWGKAYGLTGAVGSFVLKWILWLFDGVKLIIDGIGAAINSVVY